jgi:predicted ATPase/class 3 adenylate cyclase/DNA-binding winged helix-turn-helix (wHTH) protein
MNEPEARHRLAAILAADAAGYSRVMGEDDRVALATLDAARAVFRRNIEARGGRVIDTAGDSVLASFETATGAVRAAVAIQRKLSTRVYGQRNGALLSFRIGVHLGDVLEKADGSVYGDGVNIAARLQALCEPGGVMVSQAVHGAVARRIRDGFDDAGEQAMKNIPHPVRAFRLRAEVRSPAHRFGRYAVLAQERQLLIDGKPAPLGEHAFDLLLALIERRQRVVSRTELADLVWPGRVIDDTTLAVQLRALRKLLGPDLIATVPGRGYRFVPALDEDGESSAESIRNSAHSPAAAVPDPPGPKPFAPPGDPPTLLGREGDLVAVDQLLAQHRQVTVLGAGGIGKTSLALAAAHARRNAQRDGAAWVDLSSISEPTLVCAVVARALELPVASGDHQLPALVAGLKSLDVLLVLDNAEHLIDEVARLATAVMTGAPGVRLLVTSQVVLKVERERVFRLGPLAIPEPGTSPHDAMGYGAIGLFVDQAQAADPRFRVTDENVRTVIELCRHLDGLALAIKLAAVRLPLFGLRGLEQRLGDRLKLLANSSRSAPTRQQTLRAALDWSYGLLSAEEQRTFRHLGVFAGACGFSLELAGAVAGAAGQDEWAVIEHVSTLLDHSLLVDDGADPPRYRLLESAREYALQQLAERHELDAAQGRFARAMNSLMERFWEAWLTEPDMPFLSSFARELDNVRLAIGWSLEHDPRLAKALVGASSSFFLLLDLMHEYQGYAEVLEPLVSSDDVDVITARYWLGRELAQVNAGFPAARAGERAASLFRLLGDERGVAISLCTLSLSFRDHSVAQLSAIRAEMDSLAPEAWPVGTKVWRFLAEALIYIAQERFDDAVSRAEAGLVFARSKGLEFPIIVLTRYAIIAELALGRFDNALRRSHEAIDAECRWRGGAFELTLGTHAAVLTRQGRCAEARLALAQFFEASRRTGWHRFGQCACAYVELALHEQRRSSAATLLGYARAEGWGADTKRRCAELLAELEAVLDAETLGRLLAEGEALDEEAVCALTLETGGCG